MHPIRKKNKYIGLLLMKMSQEYFSLGKEGIRDVARQHKKELARFADKLTHVAITGLDARYDQITIIEADSLEDIYNAAVEFRMGAKAKFIEVVDAIVGIKALSGAGGKKEGTAKSRRS